MTEAPVSPRPEREGKRPPAAGSARRIPLSEPAARRGRRIEVVAPDQYCAALLLGYAASSFRAEIASGSTWIVTVDPPSSGGEWVLQFLSVVKRWLESSELPCAKMRYGGRSYLIRGSNDTVRSARAAV